MISRAFLRRNWRLLGFGFVMCFLSSAGQTFFISLFGGEMRATFGLSHGEFGSVYSAATLVSATMLMWAGGLIDRIDLRRYVTVVLFGLVAACVIAWSAPGLVFLGVAIFCLRFFGQGLSGHAGITAMGRYFDAQRGRAVATASLGYSAGEAVLPPLIVAALAVLVWREAWLVAAGVLLCAIPLVRWLLKGAHAYSPEVRVPTPGLAPVAVDSTLRQALADPGLWLRLPALMAPSFIFTGLIFHQIHIAGEKGWSLEALATAYSVYSGITVVTSLTGGVLIDMVTARRVVPFFLAPLAVSCLVLVFVGGPYSVFAFMGCMGLSTGMTHVLFGALWPELYGTRHLGSIKAFAQAAMVFSTGLAPGAMGLLIDAGYSVAWIAVACTAYCAAATVLAGVAARLPRYAPATKST